MLYKGKEITQEMLRQAEECESVQELMNLAKDNGIDLSLEEAEAFFDENADIELDEEALDMAAGGSSDSCYPYGDNNRVEVKDKNRIDD